jgi:pentapeptide MXKDX repeat protein
MKSVVAALLFATFVFAPAAFAQDTTKKPTAEECKKDPKMKGCETKEEKKKVKGGC